MYKLGRLALGIVIVSLIACSPSSDNPKKDIVTPPPTEKPDALKDKSVSEVLSLKYKSVKLNCQSAVRETKDGSPDVTNYRDFIIDLQTENPVGQTYILKNQTGITESFARLKIDSLEIKDNVIVREDIRKKYILKYSPEIRMTSYTEFRIKFSKDGSGDYYVTYSGKDAVREQLLTTITNTKTGYEPEMHYNDLKCIIQAELKSEFQDQWLMEDF